MPEPWQLWNAVWWSECRCELPRLDSLTHGLQGGLLRGLLLPRQCAPLLVSAHDSQICDGPDAGCDTQRRG